MKNIKCFTCKYFYPRPFSLHYNASLCMKTNTFAVNSYKIDGKCGPTFRYFIDSGLPPKYILNNIKKV